MSTHSQTFIMRRKPAASVPTARNAPKTGVPHTLRSKRGKGCPRICPPYSASIVVRLHWRPKASSRVASHPSTVSVLGVGAACVAWVGARAHRIVNYAHRLLK